MCFACSQLVFWTLCLFHCSCVSWASVSDIMLITHVFPQPEFRTDFQWGNCAPPSPLLPSMLETGSSNIDNSNFWSIELDFLSSSHHPCQPLHLFSRKGKVSNQSTKNAASFTNYTTAPKQRLQLAEIQVHCFTCYNFLYIKTFLTAFFDSNSPCTFSAGFCGKTKRLGKREQGEQQGEEKAEVEGNSEVKWESKLNHTPWIALTSLSPCLYPI